MARAKITQREIDTLRTASRRSGKTLYLWDTQLKGLGLRVLASGQGVWLVQKWIGGRRGKMARLVIGHLPPMTVDEARRQARTGGQRARGTGSERQGTADAVGIVVRTLSH